jgi:hypothetical protein
MRFVPNAVTVRAGSAVLATRTNSPALLFAGGIIGVAGTVVLACRATLKVEEVLEDTQKKLMDVKTVQHEKYSEGDRRQDLAIVYVRGAVKLGQLYGPAVVLGGLSVAALTGSHNILTRRNAAVTAAYAALEKGFKQYRERVIEEFGEDKDREFRHGSETRQVVEDTKQGPKVKTITTVGGDAPSIYARFFDQMCDPWDPVPEYNLIFIQCQQQWANDRLRAKGHVFLNEVYDALGIPRTKAGQVVGWSIKKGGDQFVDFGVFTGDQQARDFVNGRDGAILLDFNVDGIILEKI